MSKLTTNSEYKDWIASLKEKFRSTQLKAAIKVNSALLMFYWELGQEIVERQKRSSWGDAFLNQLSQDLKVEFPDVKGFSERNLKYIRQWFYFYSDENPIGQQAVAQLTQIPWGHNLKIISKCKTIEEALYYVSNIQNLRELGYER